MSIKPRPTTDLEKLIGSRSANDGVQEAHIIGKRFYSDADLLWLHPLLNVDELTNLALLPESERGSAILGVAAHIGGQSGAFDRFFYQEGANPNKFLNTLKEHFDDDLDQPGADEAAISARYRTQLLNFLDYVKVLFLYDEIQWAGGLANNDLARQSLALNSADPRFADRFDVINYYEGAGVYTIRQDLLDHDVIAGVKIDPNSLGEEPSDYLIPPNPIFWEIKEARAAGTAITDAWMVDKFPDLSRLLYPDGAVVWATGDRAKYQGIQADILSREAALSGVISLQLEDGRWVERVTPEYFDIVAPSLDPTEDTPRDLVTFEINRALTRVHELNPDSVVLTGNDLFDGLTDSDQHLFAGVFDNAFWELNREGAGEIDAYRQANATLAQVLRERSAYQAAFAIADNGSATSWQLGLSDDIATRAGIGAVLKTYATTKTIVAEGRYGTGSSDYQAWESAELANSDPVLLPVDYDDNDEITLIVGGTATAGYYRMDGANDLNLDEVRYKAFLIAGAAPLGSRTQVTAGAVGAAFGAMDLGLDLAARALKIFPQARAALLAAKIVSKLLDDVVSFDVELVSGDGATVAMDSDDLLIGIEGAYLQSSHDGNVIVHFGYGDAIGGSDGDILIGIGPDRTGAAPGVFGDTSAEDTLMLDGRSDDDWVLAIGGEKATTVGGLGRDWIYNTSADGIIWGDIANSATRADGSRFALVDGQTIEIADDRSNADNFWYAGGTTIMDAGRHDVLKFFGVTLTGGEVGSSAWSLFAGARSGSLMVAGTANGLVASAAAVVNAVRGSAGIGPIYYDTFLPFMAYQLVDNGDGGKDLVITNMVTSVIGAAFFGLSGEASRMIVKDYDIAKVGGFTSGFDALGGARTGDLGMLFRDFNPAYAIAALAPLLQGIPIAQSLMAAYQVLTLGDAAAWTANDNDAHDAREVA